MSRYLKTATATVYRNKKTYLVPGNYTFSVPFTSNEVKVMVFGGGGNSKNCCVNPVGTNGNCGYTMGAASGPGGGFSEKLFTGAAGSSACIVLGNCEANSSFCISGQGTVLSTGGKLCQGSGGCPWCHCFGIGSGGDTNRCGSPGQTQCMCWYTQCNGSCMIQCYCAGAMVAGGSPGNSVNNGIVDSLPLCTSPNYSTFLCTSGNYFGYGCCVCTLCRFYCQNAGFTRGYGCCPVSSATYYGFDWDVVGGDSCATSNFTSPSSGYGFCCVASNAGFPYCGCNCCTSSIYGTGCYGVACSGGSNTNTIGGACCNFVRYQTVSPCILASVGQTAGVTGSGGPGANGGVGGGGGGIFLSPDTGQCNWIQAGCFVCPTTFPGGCCLGQGGAGLVIVYY